MIRYALIFRYAAKAYRRRHPGIDWSKHEVYFVFAGRKRKPKVGGHRLRTVWPPFKCCCGSEDCKENQV